MDSVADLIERLQAWDDTDAEYGFHGRAQDLRLAAATLEALTQENARLREALERVRETSAMCIHQNTGRWSTDVEHDVRSFNVLHGIGATARKALGGGE